MTASPRTVEQWLAVLREPSADQLRAALAWSRPGAGIVIAAAAKHVDATLAAALADAFEPLVGDHKRDPVCRGKIAIARRLHDLDHWDDRVFAGGLRVVQVEGGEDSAAELRGVCGLAHAHFARADALDVLGELLADPQRMARVAAAQALGDAGRPDASAMLRFKLVSGDEPEVLSACSESLLALARDRSIEFLIRLLATYDDRAEAAALALGTARANEATAPLVAWCRESRPEPRHRVGFLALALLRDDAANAHLVEVMRTGARTDAIAAARALATFAELVDAPLRREIDALLAT